MRKKEVLTEWLGKETITLELRKRFGRGSVLEIVDSKPKSTLTLKLFPSQAIVNEEYTLVPGLAEFGGNTVRCMCKLVSLNFLHDQDFTQILEGEAQDLAEMQDCKQVVNLIHAGQIVVPTGSIFPGKVFILAMEYLRGQNLKELRLSGQLPLTDKLVTKTLCDDLIEGLLQMHARNVPHGDIKSSNVMIDLQSENPSATYIDLHNKIGITPSTAAPEVFANIMRYVVEADIDTLSSFDYQDGITLNPGHNKFLADIYSLGVVLLELISGELLISEHTHLALKFHDKAQVEVHIENRLNEIFANHPEIFTPALQDFFRQIITVRPENRYQNMDSVKQAFRLAYGSEEES